MEESLSHSMGYTPGIFDNIFRWHFVLEIDISMTFRGHMHYYQCLLKYMVICAFENSPSIPSLLTTQIVYIVYGQFKENYPFSFDLSKAVFLIF
jgi:hypothetical protein